VIVFALLGILNASREADTGIIACGELFRSLFLFFGRFAGLVRPAKEAFFTFPEKFASR
jgi:hypothetical protein